MCVVGKIGKQCKMAKIRPSELFWKMGRSAEQSKLGIHDNFKPLWWEKIEEKNGKTKLGHSESF